ncbi:MAG: hypothetical protein K0U68_09970, partial [Gammaproteobacteria bacterium]|nr:hypothetical protein [Gammaproteobacteria bacterium]
STGSLPLSGNVVAIVAGNGESSCQDDPTCGDGKQATEADLKPEDVVVGPDGSVYVSDWLKNRVRRIDPDGTISTVAGNGNYCSTSSTPGCGDGGLAIDAPIGSARGLALGPDGSLYISSFGLVLNDARDRVRRVLPNGRITTIVGTGERGFSGDGGLATEAKLAAPISVAATLDGSVYIADLGNGRVRRIGTAGIITTVAGNGMDHGVGTAGSGDGGPATEAIIRPVGIAVDSDGVLYISDDSIVDGMRIRRVGTDGIITTIAGSNCNGFYRNDGISATDACITLDGKVAVGADGSVYLGSYFQRRIRRIGTDGIITTVAGNGKRGLSADGESALQSTFSRPVNVALGPAGNLYVVDQGNNDRIRRIGPPGDRLQDLTLRVASEDGREVYEFDASGRHLATRHALTGAVLYSFSYNTAGQLISVTDGDQNATTIQRTADGQPSSITGPYGQITVLSMDQHGYLDTITNPAGESHQMIYTDSGLLTDFSNPRQLTSTYAYTTEGRLKTARNPENGGLNLEYVDTGTGYQVIRTSVLNRQTVYSVETAATGSQTRTTTFPNGTQSTTQSGSDNRYEITSPSGLIKERIESADPRFSTQAPLAQSITLKNGGLKRTLTHDRTVELSKPDDPFSLTRQTDTFSLNGRIFIRDYDALLRTFTNTSAENRQSTTAIDLQGRLAKTEIPGILPTTLTYDNRGRVKTMTQGNRVMQFFYKLDGHLEKIIDPINREALFDYDQAGRIKTQTLFGNRTVSYNYDANGNIKSITPPGKSAHTFEYTDIDLESTYNPPAVSGGGSTQYDYNLDRQLELVTRPDGIQLDYQYQADGRLKSLTIPRGVLGYEYNAKGQLEKITAPDGGTVNYRYDNALLERITSTGVVSGRVEFEYDDDFRLSQVEVNRSNPIAYSYDGDGLLTQAGDLTLTYRSDNPLLAGSSLGNVSDSYSHNPFGEMSGYTAKYNSSVLYDVIYSQDKLGRIAQKAETIAGVQTTLTYTYDTAGRLDTVSQNNVKLRDYDYDANGNRTHVNGAQLGQYDNQDRLLSYAGITFEYTANGELKTKTEGSQVTQYHYDVLGNLISVVLPNSTVIDYIIDGQIRRVGKKVNGTLQQGFLYHDQLNPVAELDGNGDVISRFIYASRGNVPDYIIKNSGTYRVITDQLGSPRLIVDVATGVIAQRLDYDEFGNVLLDTSPGFQPFGFAGGIYDLDTGLVRFGARDYDASIGRWTSKDQILFSSGSFNHFIYANNNPTSLIDPHGKYATVIVGAGIRYFGGRALAGAIGNGLRGVAGRRLGNVLNCVVLGGCSDFIDDLTSNNEAAGEGQGSSSNSGDSCPTSSDEEKPDFGNLPNPIPPKPEGVTGGDNTDGDPFGGSVPNNKPSSTGGRKRGRTL